MRILIAEDDATSRLVLEMVLEKWGHEVIATSDGSEAWEVLRAEDAPPLAILDRMMPGQDGTELCRRVRELNRTNPSYIILLTALGQEEDIVAGLEAGADDYVRKPFSNKELHARVQVAQRIIELQTALSDQVEELEDALSELAKAKQAATDMALHDPLTGLPNRRYFAKQLSSAIARASRTNRSAAILCFDLDGFKRVNDTFGHDAGDRVLETVASRAQRCLRKNVQLARGETEEIPTVARIGGDEFTIVVESIRCRDDLVRIAQRVQEAIARPIEIADAQAVRLTPSIGITVYPDDGQTVETLLKNADLAMYRAKRQGRNNFQFFTEDLEVKPVGLLPSASAA